MSHLPWAQEIGGSNPPAQTKLTMGRGMPSGNLHYIPLLRHSIRESVRSFPKDEPAFSREWFLLRAAGCCWICHFPLGRANSHDALQPSRDHVIPRSANGTSTSSNVRMAHRWCNSHRKSDAVGPDIIMRCRNHMIEVHGRWLREVANVAEDGLVVKPQALLRLIECHGSRLPLSSSPCCNSAKPT